jgi:ankyrin repeat protein
MDTHKHNIISAPNFPSQLAKGLEYLDKGDVKRGKDLLVLFSKQKPESFMTYKIEALNYFIYNKPDSTAKELESEINAIKVICEVWDLEKSAPHLALKAYCYAGLTDKVKSIIDKVKDINCRAFTDQAPIVDCLNQDNHEIVDTLLKHGALSDTSSLRLSMNKVAKSGYTQSLRTLLGNIPTTKLDPGILRDASNRAIVNKNLDCYKLLCAYAQTPCLENWKNQMTQLVKAGESDPIKPKYKEEQKILNMEISKRRLVSSLEGGKFNKTNQMELV